MISLIVTLEIAPEGLSDFIQRITEEAESARTKEPGCLRFEVSQGIDSPCVFTLAELYRDEQKFKEYAAQTGCIVK
jgi:autoinducer 2-degrading protein